jgi:hypothetical protein
LATAWDQAVTYWCCGTLDRLEETILTVVQDLAQLARNTFPISLTIIISFINNFDPIIPP